MDTKYLTWYVDKFMGDVENHQSGKQQMLITIQTGRARLQGLIHDDLIHFTLDASRELGNAIYNGTIGELDYVIDLIQTRCI